ncbi:hypothetical protein Closa_1723 [[Clostridium] saccharolyticum WM1]|uniref:Uncharacterized protein n=1 Tax=Lacrimispora saccharolytica (strain ATCC 35040 / DSM 2544 / NRCC 2533 / WM1) TaxID=610130 RepID=D9QZ68_LACSW|nr:hypothetical protein Closa_1723 [[Clostridium] saccharolyticum WM1]
MKRNFDAIRRNRIENLFYIHPVCLSEDKIL